MLEHKDVKNKFKILHAKILAGLRKCSLGIKMILLQNQKVLK